MSFSKVNPPGWAFGAKLTSAQMNQLDSDHANALDKSVAGDHLLGVVGINPGGAIVSLTSAGLQPTVTDGFYCNTVHGARGDVAGAFYATNIGGFQGEVAGGIRPTVAEGISDGGITAGIRATVANGISSRIFGGISTTVAGGISDGVAGGITLGQQHGLKSATSGGNGILLSGGNEYIDYQVARGKTRAISLAPPGFNISLGTGWSIAFASGPALVGAATTNNIIIPLNHLLSGDVNGAKLQQATLCFAVGTSHTGVPTLPFVNIWRQPLSGGSSPGGAVSLFSGGPWSMASTSGTSGWTVPTSGALWYSSGNVQQFQMLPNQNNNPIDLTQYMYWMQIQDESTPNQQTGNLYFALLCLFQNIGNSEPG